MGIPALDPHNVRVPRIPRRDVLYLTKSEIEAFVNGIIAPNEAWSTASISRLRFRALVEVLLGTGARISEALSLTRDSIDADRKEAKIIGKGNKERVLFFSDRALLWLQRYLSTRRDDEKAVFVTTRGAPRRLERQAIKRQFKAYQLRAGITKKVTPHILRHTMATTLLFNGCPIGHIKDILGHERLETTCRYYLGLDKRAARHAHENFLRYDDTAAMTSVEARRLDKDSGG